MRREKADDLERVHVTNDTHAAAPGIPVAVGQNQVPPQAHLFLQRRPDSGENVFPIRSFRGFPDEPCVFV